METFKEMIEAYRNVQDIEHKIKERLETIVNETICPIANVEKFSIDSDGFVNFRYEMENGQGIPFLLSGFMTDLIIKPHSKNVVNRKRRSLKMHSERQEKPKSMLVIKN